jgi:hypothetical protein
MATGAARGAANCALQANAVKNESKASGLLGRPEAIFFSLSVLFGAITILANPPLRGPDEPAHFWRAVGIARGDFFASTFNEPGHVGLFIAPRWHRQFDHFNRIRQLPPTERPTYWEIFRGHFAQDRMPVTATEPVFVSYEGSQLYSPVPYMHYALAAFAAKAFDLSFLSTLYLLRITGLFAAAAITAWAIAVTPALKWGFISIAMLPTAIYQRAVVNTDGIVLAASFLVIALCLKAVRTPASGLAGRTLWITLSSLTKPPQVAFALLEAMRIAGPAWRTEWRAFLAVSIPGLVVAVLWIVFGVLDGAGLRADLAGSGAPSTSVGPLLKLQFVISHPIQFAGAAFATVLHSPELWKQLIGVLGWLDVRLPVWAYVLLSVLLVLTFIDRLDLGRSARPRIAAVAILTALAYCGAVFAIFFVTDTSIGASRIYGVQGRYFIVVLPLLAIIVSALLDRRLGGWTRLAALGGALTSIVAMTDALWEAHWQ